jgi:catechol 2,3-dioxygenase-like lactoylglutathione lyase family enzyme
MAIIPTVRCSNMQASLAFYTGILDFVRVDGNGRPGDPSYNVLVRGEDRGAPPRSTSMIRTGTRCASPSGRASCWLTRGCRGRAGTGEL